MIIQPFLLCFVFLFVFPKTGRGSAGTEQPPSPIAKVFSGAAQGVLSASIVLPMASLVHDPGVHAHLTLHWRLIVTFIPLACIALGGTGSRHSR